MPAAIVMPPVPPAHDLKYVLALLVLGGGFVLIMILDLFVSSRYRSVLAGLTVAVLAATFGAVLFGWFDAGEKGATAFYDTWAYDRFSFFIDSIVVLTALLATMISPAYLNRRGLHYGEYYALILGATAGMMVLAHSLNLMMVFLGIELLSLALYVLSGFAHTEERSQEAGLKYLLLGGFASGFLLFGMALVYGETGHTSLPGIAASITVGLSPGQPQDPLLYTGIVLIFVGLAFKISAAPFHLWTPDVYQGAPTSVVAFMSVATKVAAFAALIRVFSVTFVGRYDKWSGFVIFVAIVSMVVGNLFALTQNSVKRMLGYSGVAQAGYILIGVAVQSPSATTAALYYLAAYAAMNLGVFACITIMAGRGEDIDDYNSLRGLFYRHPYVAGAMAFFLFSLGGFPPTVGFVAKFLVFSAAIQQSYMSLAFWGIATSAVSAFYYLRVGLLLFQRPREGEATYEWSRTTLAGGTVLLTTTAATLGLGIFISFLYNAATMAQAGIKG